MRAGAVVVHDGPWYAVAVMPAGARLDLARLRHLTRRWGLCVAEDAALPGLFPGWDATELPPPFARRYGLDLYLDRALLRERELEIRGRGADPAVRVALNEYLLAERPAVAELSVAA
jgi:prolyl-tRNA editing enzyme YbaK/EbsC (Cys-tRNA(Pro) deacylase)